MPAKSGLQSLSYGESWSGDHSYGESQLQTAPAGNRGLETTPTGNRSCKLLLREITVTNCSCGKSQLQTAPTGNRGLETTPTGGSRSYKQLLRGRVQIQAAFIAFPSASIKFLSLLWRFLLVLQSFHFFLDYFLLQLYEEGGRFFEFPACRDFVILPAVGFDVILKTEDIVEFGG